MKRILYSIFYLLLVQQIANANMYDEVSVAFTNDILFTQDQDYTSGIELSYKPSSSDFIYYLGQEIYTPKNKKSTIPTIGEHPYAAYLYLGTSKIITLNNNFINNLKVRIGTIGDKARGKSVNNEIHNIIGATQEKGWDTQVYQEFSYNVSINSSYKPLYIQYNNHNIKPYLVADIGNILTNIGLGIGIDSQINNSLTLYANGERKYIDKNIFLTGSNKDGSTVYAVKKINYKNTLVVGLKSTHFTNYTVNAEVTFNSKEYETQETYNHYTMIKINRRF